MLTLLKGKGRRFKVWNPRRMHAQLETLEAFYKSTHALTQLFCTLASEVLANNRYAHG